jgi:cytidylate kinase
MTPSPLLTHADPSKLEPFSEYKYRNISISGLPGGGSTTLLNELREVLKFDGWTGFSGGEFMRAYALEKGLFKEVAGIHHDASHYEDEFDRQIDFGMRAKFENHNRQIIESWLSGFMAQGVPKVLKVLMYCSDDAVRIDRIVNRDQVTVEFAKQHMRERYEANLTKWQRLYKEQWLEWVVKPGLAKTSDPIDFWRPDLYDIVIDTYSTNQKQGLEIVLNAIKT